MSRNHRTANDYYKCRSYKDSEWPEYAQNGMYVWNHTVISFFFASIPVITFGKQVFFKIITMAELASGMGECKGRMLSPVYSLCSMWQILHGRSVDWARRMSENSTFRHGNETSIMNMVTTLQ